MSDGIATEGEDLQVCVLLGGGTVTQIEVVIPLIVVDGKAGMLNLSWLMSFKGHYCLDSIYHNTFLFQMQQI